MEKCDSGMEQWTQQTAVAGELFGFRRPRPPREGNWPVAILDKGRLSSEQLWAPTSNSHCEGEAERSSDWQEGKEPISSQQGAEFKLARGTLNIAGSTNQVPDSQPEI